ncbi:MAG: deoxynucleoside kinase [Candidatus Bathyarchaeia archaeon]
MEKYIEYEKKVKFISVEGSDGVGKSTVVCALKNEFANAEGVDSVLVYKVPRYDDSRSARLLKYLFGKDWYVHGVLKAFSPLHLLLIRLETLRVETSIKQILAGMDDQNRVIIIGDRSALSNYVYAELYKDKFRRWLNRGLVNLLFKNTMLPDITFFISVKPEEIVRRINERDKSISEAEKARLTRMQDAYHRVFGSNASAACKLLRHTESIVIDGNKSKEEVYSEISRIVWNRIKRS